MLIAIQTATTANNEKLFSICLLNVTELLIFWHDLENFIFKIVGLNIHFSKLEILFGYQNFNRNSTMLNAILVVAKKYIYDTNRKSGIYSLTALKQKIQQTYHDEYYLACLKNKQESFIEQWGRWCPLIGT